MVAMKWVGLFVWMCCAVLVIPGVASGDEPAMIQATLAPDGSGSMLANVATGHPGEVWSWSVCAPDGSECAAFGSGQAITTGATPAGHVFVATETLSGASVTSPLWNGPDSPATPPHVAGEVRANALVTPVAGTWAGGWSGDFDVTQLAACTSAEGTGCTSLTSPTYTSGCPGGAAVIDPAFTGQYLRVADQVYGPNTAFSLAALSSPYGASVWPAGPTVSVAMAGEILAQTGPREASCGPPPIGQQPGSPEAPPRREAARPPVDPLHHRPSVTLTHRGVVFVRCPSACRILTTVRRGARKRSIAKALRRGGGWELHLSAPALAGLGRGRAQLSVRVDGALIARRSVRLAG